MTIFDVPGLDSDDAYEQVQRTLNAHPRLRELYDDHFIRRLIRRRRGQNYLLFMLVQPENRVTLEYWSWVVDDLVLLEAESAFERFRQKLRARDQETLEAGRSELALAARLKRLGFTISLEEPTRNGRDCDFAAGTTPPTCWEVKAIRDLDAVVRDEAIAFEIQSRLRRIEEPYILSLVGVNAAQGDVPAAIRDLKRQISRHFQCSAALPKRFHSMGIELEATRLTRRGKGYLGSTFTGARIFGSEHADKIRDRVVSAIGQLPSDRAGVVVIDTTSASWVDQEDVVDACFGVLSMAFVNNECREVRGADAAVFQPDQRTRVSAVVHYTRHPRDRGQSLLVIRNPFARIPLPLETLAADDVQQLSRIEVQPGSFMLIKTPPDRAADT